MKDPVRFEITCRQKDRKLFESLGFRNELAPTGPEGTWVTLRDPARNYANLDGMPDDVPWFGFSEAGGSFSAYYYCCRGDGVSIHEIEVDAEGDGYFVRADEQGQILKEDVLRIRSFCEEHARVRKIVMNLKPDKLEQEEDCSEGLLPRRFINPLHKQTGDEFEMYQIQYVRRVELDNGETIYEPLHEGELPDPEAIHEEVVVGIYGVWRDGTLEHIADRADETSAVNLLNHMGICREFPGS